jgi:hypothetical protein
LSAIIKAFSCSCLCCFFACGKCGVGPCGWEWQLLGGVMVEVRWDQLAGWRRRGVVEGTDE